MGGITDVTGMQNTGIEALSNKLVGAILKAVNSTSTV